MAAFLLLFSCPHSGNGILIRRLNVGSVAVCQVERTVVDAVILQRVIRVDRDGKAAAEAVMVSGRILLAVLNIGARIADDGEPPVLPRKVAVLCAVPRQILPVSA